MSEAVVLYDVTGPLATITFNRPDKLNALNAEAVRLFDQYLTQSITDDAVKVILLKGNGRSFSAGFDLDDDVESGTRTPLEWLPELRANVDLTMRVWSSPKPTIAVVQGHCLAGTFELAMACDLIVAAENAKFGEPEIKTGYGVGALLMPFVLGQKKTYELLLTGDTIDAAEARAIGLVNKVVPLEELEEAAHALAMRIAPTPLPILRLTKHSLLRAYDVKGVRAAVEAHIDISAILNGANLPEQLEFARVASESGLKAALALRESRYADQGDDSVKS